MGRSSNTPSMEVEPVLLAEPDPSSADSLVSTNEPDDLANEQTWPTEEEMNGTGGPIEHDIPDAAAGTTPKRVLRIPKGMSEYQAAWIIDDDEAEEVEDGSEDGEMKIHEEEEEEEMQNVTMDETQMDMDQGEKVHFQDLDIQEEEKEYVLPTLLVLIIIG
jgi:pre-rRNA-processing protein TSR1